VRVVDFGIRGLDLAYDLLDGYEAVVLVDATPRGGTPGTLYVLEVDAAQALDGDAPAVEAHSLDPVKVLRLAASMGGRVERVYLVGCEPATPIDVEDMSMGLSAPVQAAVAEAIPLIEALVAELLRGEAPAAGEPARTINQS
jgi:hydrogenase maturation protease